MSLDLLGILCARTLCALVGGMDGHVAGWFRAHMSPALAWFYWALSAPGSGLWVSTSIIAAALWLAWRKHWIGVGRLVLTIPTGAGLGELIKIAVQRPRPFVGGPFGVWGGYSFPSGHTIAATLLYGSLLVLLLPALKNRRHQAVAILLALFMIASVAFSRVALGAHYLTDVLAAMILGSGWIFLIWLGVEGIKRWWSGGLSVAQRKTTP